MELGATDHQRIGLTPILRRVWSPRGPHPAAVVQHRYQWGYLDAFVRPCPGQPWWLLLPPVSIAALTLALTACAHAMGAGPGTPVLRGLDGAGWHLSPQVQVPAGLHRHFLPPYAPERQPAER